MDPIQKEYWESQFSGNAGAFQPAIPTENHFQDDERRKQRMQWDPVSRIYWTQMLGTSQKVTNPADESAGDGYARTEVTTKSSVKSTSEGRAEVITFEEKLAALRQNAKYSEDAQAVFMEPDEGTPAAEALAANAALHVGIVTKGLRKLKAQKIKRSAMKKLNIVKQLRKTQGGKQFSKNFKGKVIDGVHELYTLTAGMMLGMRCSVGRNHPGFQLQLTLEDFCHVEKITFPASGSSTTPPHSLAHTFKFKSYSLKVFRRIRDFFGIENVDYMNSVCGNYNYLEFISNSKSGQFFFYSHDGKYMIKTQTREENKFMKQILPHYYKFVTENPHTLLCRIVGMHRVKMYHLRRQVRFVIMTSVFDTPEKIHRVYDLKGSLIGRQASTKERENGGVLKDLDLVNDGKRLHLGSKKATFMSQLKRDAMFLAQLNIMDYSLLVGIHERDQRKAAGSAPRAVSDGDDGVLFGQLGQHSNTPFRRRQSSHAENAPSPQQAPSSSTRATVSLKTSTALGGSTTAPAEGASCSSNAESPSVAGTPPASPAMAATTRKQLQPPFPSLVPLSLALASGSLPPESPASVGVGASRKQSNADETGQPGPGTAGAAPGSAREGALVHPSLHISVRSKSGNVQFEGGAADTVRERRVARRDSNLSSADEGDSDEEDDEDDVLEEQEQELELEQDDEHCDDGDSTSSVIRVGSGAGGGSSRQFQFTALGGSGVQLGSGSGSGSLVSGVAVADAPQRLERADTNKGWTGLEGSRLKRMVRKVDDDNDAVGLWTEKVTFGPGASQKRPWTRRRDGGINSRMPEMDTRGREIYFCGVIDILQQYNLRKRSETFFKSFTNDSKLISSVDAFTYATRFVRFIGDNTT